MTLAEGGERLDEHQTMRLRLDYIPDVLAGPTPFLLGDMRDTAKMEKMRRTSPRISAVRAICSEREQPIDKAMMVAASAEMLRPILFNSSGPMRDSHLWIVLAHAYPIALNRIARHKQSWRDIEQFLPIEVRPAESGTLVESAEGARYLVAARVAEHGLSGAVQLLHDASYPSMLIYSAKPHWSSPDALRDLFEVCFRNPQGEWDSGIRWADLATNRCPSGELVIRPSGSWCELAFGLDVLGIASMLSAFCDFRSMMPSEPLGADDL